MKIKDLKPAPYNPRTITDDKLAALGKSMKEFGDISGVVMNIQTGNLVGGHQRMKHFDPSWPIKKRKHADATGTVALGEIETPFGVWSYREVDWPKPKEIAANISANQSGGLFDYPVLKDLLIEIKDSDLDMDLIGFDDSELGKLFNEIILPEDDEPSRIRKNFAGNLGGSSDDESLTETAPLAAYTDGKYPITFILHQEEWERWEQVKKRAWHTKRQGGISENNRRERCLKYSWVDICFIRQRRIIPETLV